jgi:hypothetical protein
MSATYGVFAGALAADALAKAEIWPYEAAWLASTVARVR